MKATVALAGSLLHQSEIAASLWVIDNDLTIDHEILGVEAIQKFGEPSR